MDMDGSDVKVENPDEVIDILTTNRNYHFDVNQRPTTTINYDEIIDKKYSSEIEYEMGIDTGHGPGPTGINCHIQSSDPDPNFENIEREYSTDFEYEMGIETGNHNSNKELDHDSMQKKTSTSKSMICHRCCKIVVLNPYVKHVCQIDNESTLSPNYVCNLCPNKYFSRNSMRRHLKNNHKKEMAGVENIGDLFTVLPKNNKNNDDGNNNYSSSTSTSTITSQNSQPSSNLVNFAPSSSQKYLLLPSTLSNSSTFQTPSASGSYQHYLIIKPFPSNSTTIVPANQNQQTILNYNPEPETFNYHLQINQQQQQQPGDTFKSNVKLPTNNLQSISNKNKRKVSTTVKSAQDEEIQDDFFDFLNSVPTVPMKSKHTGRELQHTGREPEVPIKKKKFSDGHFPCDELVDGVKCKKVCKQQRYLDQHKKMVHEPTMFPLGTLSLPKQPDTDPAEVQYPYLCLVKDEVLQ